MNDQDIKFVCVPIDKDFCGFKVFLTKIKLPKEIAGFILQTDDNGRIDLKRSTVIKII